MSCTPSTLLSSIHISQAPELFNGTRVDEKCDVFSLGGILYKCYTGRVPFEELSRGAQASMGLFQVHPCLIPLLRLIR